MLESKLDDIYWYFGRFFVESKYFLVGILVDPKVSKLSIVKNV